MFCVSCIVGAWVPSAQGVTNLVWSDEFNGTNIDLTKWTFDIGNGSSGWGNNELEYYTSRTNNAYVTGGFLHIRAQRENTNGFAYTSARMKTQGLFSKTYGRIEWRAKLPAGVGFWPALWSLGTNITSIGWPGCGEIDVVENNGATITFVQGSIHSGSDATKVFNFSGGNTITNFHVYDLDWRSNSITWSVDGVAYETQTNWTSSTGNPYPFPFNQRFFFLMNLAVGGTYLGNPSTNDINPSLPGEVVIDYMRVYDDTPLAPLILSVIPSNGCLVGGTAITITGSNFQSNASVTIGGAAAGSVSFVNSNTLTAVTPANPAGPQNIAVTVTNTLSTMSPPTYTLTGVLTNGFTYGSALSFGGLNSATPATEAATLSWSAASGTPPITYNVFEATTSGAENFASPVLTTNGLSTFIAPLYPGSNSPITYFFVVRAVDGCGNSDSNSVEQSLCPLLDPTKSQVGDGIRNGWKQQYGFNPFDTTVAAADPDGDGMSNLQEFLAGTDPTNSASYFHVTSIATEGNNIRVTWMMGSGRTNALQATSGDPAGSYLTNFTDIFTVTNTVGWATNYLDIGAATNGPARYYRVRLVP